jgi:hypothetical protein
MLLKLMSILFLSFFVFALFTRNSGKGYKEIFSIQIVCLTLSHIRPVLSIVRTGRRAQAALRRQVNRGQPNRVALAHRIVGEVDDLRGGGIEPHGQKNAGRGGRALRQGKREDLPLARAHLNS